MRKLLWCFTAALAAAGTLSAGAYQVCQHPDSLLSQGVCLAAEVALPVQALRSLQHVLPSAQTSAVAEEPGKNLVPAEPKPAAVSEPPVVAATTMSRVVVKSSDTMPDAPPVIVVNEDNPAVPENKAPAAVASAPQTTMPMVDDSQAPPAIMPYVSDEPGPQAKMPEVGEEEDRGTEEKPSAFQSWLRFFTDPACSHAAAKPPEAVEPEGTSGCQEDRNYHQHYPGCPYTGGCGDVCPYTGHSKPTATPKQLPKGGEEASEDEPRPSKKVQHHRVNKTTEKDEPVRQPGIDTMEYRPSDGPLDETGTGGPF
jgi:hypothetical protein